MANNRSGDWSPALSDEARRLHRLLNDAIPHEWLEVEGGRALRFVHPLRLGEFCEAMMLRDDLGYASGAQFFMTAVLEKNIERTVCSHLLTRMALTFHEALSAYADSPLLESHVATFGRFVRHLLKDMPERVVEWSEDMNVDDPQRDLRKQPTALIRGVLLSPAISQSKCEKFWDSAARAADFPLRIFSDPCAPRDGILFSTFHLRVFGAVFSVVSGEALTRFAGHMRECATEKLLLEVISDGKWQTVRAPVDAYERRSAFECIVGNVEPTERRERVAQLLQVA
jgi:hypothetical protein